MRLQLRSSTLAPSLLILACLSSTAQAVHIDADGRGQVLLYPYYTVNGGKATLISLTNTTAEAKAVRVRLLESRNGRNVLSLNLYLAPFDVWTGAISAPPAGADYANAAAARLSTGDRSCTVPPIPALGLDFFNYDYATGTTKDSGPYELSRTREGHIEVIEMGRLFDTPDFAPARAATHTPAGVPENCAMLTNAWLHSAPADQRQWLVNPNLGLRSPTGGLRGTVVIVDVPQGSSLNYSALALDGFFQPDANCAPDCSGVTGENLHTSIGHSAPNLGSARSAEHGRAVAEFHHAGQSFHIGFEGEDAGLKAVSALLMRRELDNGFNLRQDPALRATSEWVLNFPTKHLHVSHHSSNFSVNLERRLPFTAAYAGGHAGSTPPYAPLVGACEHFQPRYWDREARAWPRDLGVPPPPLPHAGPVPALCYSTQVISFDTAATHQDSTREVLRGAPASPLLGSAHALQLSLCPKRDEVSAGGYGYPYCYGDLEPRFTEGRLRLHLGIDRANFLFSTRTPDPSQPGRANLLLGLPVIGFAATEFTGSGTPGVLANFATIEAHSGQRAPRAANILGITSWEPAADGE